MVPTVHEDLRRIYPDTIGKWRYIEKYNDDIPIPDENYRMYLSPPVPGFIVTPARLDGHGTQLSTHMVVFGGGGVNETCAAYNKVYS